MEGSPRRSPKGDMFLYVITLSLHIQEGSDFWQMKNRELRAVARSQAVITYELRALMPLSKPYWPVLIPQKFSERLGMAFGRSYVSFRQGRWHVLASEAVLGLTPNSLVSCPLLSHSGFPQAENLRWVIVAPREACCASEGTE